jgi:hypothetical protein
MEKYEKIEFDMNTIDSAYKTSFSKGWNLFDHIDTLSYRKTYLPIFINESLSDVYGNNKESKEKIKGKIKNSGFSNNQQIMSL